MRPFLAGVCSDPTGRYLLRRFELAANLAIRELGRMDVHIILASLQFGPLGIIAGEPHSSTMEVIHGELGASPKAICSSRLPERVSLRTWLCFAIAIKST
jgi:hypothetical protein